MTYKTCRRGNSNAHTCTRCDACVSAATIRNGVCWSECRCWLADWQLKQQQARFDLPNGRWWVGLSPHSAVCARVCALFGLLCALMVARWANATLCWCAHYSTTVRVRASSHYLAGQLCALLTQSANLSGWMAWTVMSFLFILMHMVDLGRRRKTYLILGNRLRHFIECLSAVFAVGNAVAGVFWVECAEQGKTK